MKTGYSFGSLASFVETINNTTVKLTGNQTIAGIKTFSSNPISSAAQGTGGSYLTRKDYVDGALALKAPLASPALTGVPTAPTAAAGTNTTQIATTAFVQSAAASAVTAKASSAAPLMDGVATSGTSTNYAREGHIHPTDTSRAPLASPTLTGTPTAPTAAAGTNTTQIATTAFVTSANTGQLATATPLMDGTAAVGTSTLLARQDHIHPTDASRAPLASPSFTGTPEAPTATAGTSTTQIATTAFVQVAKEAARTTTYIASSETAMLALSANVGDVAVRTDLSKSYILRVAGAATLANWQELITPTDSVQSVDGMTGVVTLPSATESVKGKAQIATQTEVNIGTDNTKFVTPSKLKAWVKQASESILGMMKVATQMQTDLGLDDSVAVTPKKLSRGFSVSLGPYGYIALPSWMGGLIIQWASVLSNNTGFAPVTWPTPFPNTCFTALSTPFVGEGAAQNVNFTITQLGAPSTTGYNCSCWVNGAQSNVAGQVGVRYISIGY